MIQRNIVFLTEKRDIIRYTDDSEMALCICASLRRLDGFSARDMAKT